jgi:hypothetical protein
MKSKQRQISGKIAWVDLETGFWAIVDSRYRKWRLTNPPAALRHNGLRVKALVEVEDGGFSIFMTGNTVKVLSYEIIQQV